MSDDFNQGGWNDPRERIAQEPSRAALREQQRREWREMRDRHRQQRRQSFGRYGMNLQGASCSNQYSGMIIGVLIITAGILFLLRNLGIFYFDSLWQYWPLILIAWAASRVISAPHSASNVTPALIGGGLGVLFLLRNLGIIDANPWGFIWPAILIAVGSSMLLRHLERQNEAPLADESGEPIPPPFGINDLSGSGSNRLHAEVVFGGLQRKITSQDFEGGKVATVFGGAEIDLTQASTKRSEVVIQADAVFGGIELWVPATWQTEVRGTGFFGGYIDKTHPSAQPIPNAPRLIIKGGAVFGGVTVYN